MSRNGVKRLGLAPRGLLTRCSLKPAQGSVAIVLLLALLSPTGAAGRSCDAVEQWARILEREIPAADLWEVRVGRDLYDRILANLYSDRHFVPLAGKSFAQLDERERMATWKRVQGCQRKKAYRSNHFLSWLTTMALSPLSTPRVGDEVALQVPEMAQVAREYDEALARVNAGGLNLHELLGYRELSSTRFRVLLPGQIERYAAAVARQETLAADREGLPIPPPQDHLQQTHVKRHGTLLKKTGAYSLYLSPIMTCRQHDFGNGDEHWLNAVLIFSPYEELPLGTAFDDLFRSSLLPAIDSAAAAACRVSSARVTLIRFQLHFDGYAPKSGLALSDAAADG